LIRRTVTIVNGYSTGPQLKVPIGVEEKGSKLGNDNAIIGNAHKNFDIKLFQVKEVMRVLIVDRLAFIN